VLSVETLFLLVSDVTLFFRALFNALPSPIVEEALSRFANWWLLETLFLPIARAFHHAA
jgi:hypothetical protein